LFFFVYIKAYHENMEVYDAFLKTTLVDNKDKFIAFSAKDGLNVPEEFKNVAEKE